MTNRETDRQTDRQTDRHTANATKPVKKATFTIAYIAMWNNNNNIYTFICRHEVPTKRCSGLASDLQEKMQSEMRRAYSALSTPSDAMPREK